jgi:hypothetical protein
VSATVIELTATVVMAMQWHHGAVPHFSAGGAIDSSRQNGTTTDPTTHTTGDLMATLPDGIRPFAQDLARFFGAPDVQKVRNYNPGDYAQENYDYPEAFNKLWGNNGQQTRNEFISRIIHEKTKASDAWQLTKLAPLQLKKGNLEIEWDVILFEKGLADRVPERATPRMLTSRSTGGKAGMVRYALGMLMEINFLTTPAGNRHYVATIEQMRIAVDETTSYGAMVAVMTHLPYVSVGAPVTATAPMSQHEAEAMMKRETQQFGIFHKDPGSAMQTVSNELAAQLEDNNVTSSSLLIMPRGTRAFAQKCGMDKFYATGRRNGSTSALPQGVELVESRTFQAGQGVNSQHDPCYNFVTVANDGARARRRVQVAHDELADLLRTARQLRADPGEGRVPDGGRVGLPPSVRARQ